MKKITYVKYKLFNSNKLKLIKILRKTIYVNVIFNILHHRLRFTAQYYYTILSRENRYYHSLSYFR